MARWPQWARILLGSVLVCLFLLGLIALSSYSMRDHWLQFHTVQELERPRPRQ